MHNLARAESEECNLPPFKFEIALEISDNMLTPNKVYNFYVEEDAYLVVNGLTGAKRTVQRFAIAQEMLDHAVAPVLRQVFKLPVFAIV